MTLTPTNGAHVMLPCWKTTFDPRPPRTSSEVARLSAGIHALATTPLAEWAPVADEYQILGPFAALKSGYPLPKSVTGSDFADTACAFSTTGLGEETIFPAAISKSVFLLRICAHTVVDAGYSGLTTVPWAGLVIFENRWNSGELASGPAVIDDLTTC